MYNGIIKFQRIGKMKKETEFALYEAMKRGGLVSLDIDRLFDIYTTIEVTTIDDLFKDHSDFRSFIIDNIEFFDLEEDSDKGLISSVAYLKLRCFRILSNKFFKTHRGYQETFAKEVEELVGRDKSVKILEVGSGEIPFSSIILGNDGYDVTTMDDFFVSPECLAHFNVKSFRQLFNDTTRVKDYDIVVGRRPCSAIESIVASCKRDNIPYFMKLCGCKSPTGNISGWRPILTSLDRGITFNATYAYNLKDSPFNKLSKVEDIIMMDTDRSYA